MEQENAKGDVALFVTASVPGKSSIGMILVGTPVKPQRTTITTITPTPLPPTIIESSPSPTPSESAPGVASLNLTGNWVGRGYGCEQSGLVENVEISVSRNYLTARKTSGDKCVPAGNITFEGMLPGFLTVGSSFPVTWISGSPSKPASSKTIERLTILNVNEFSLAGVKFTRVVDPSK